MKTGYTNEDIVRAIALIKEETGEDVSDLGLDDQAILNMVGAGFLCD